MGANILTFRKQAVAAQSDTLYGAPLVAAMPRTGLLIAAALGVSLAGLLFAGWAQYTRKEHVAGYLAPTRGLVKVYTPQAGAVVERRVVEGQAVRRGDVLMVISSDRSTATTRDAQAAVLGQLKDRRDSLEREQSKQDEIDRLTGSAVAQRVRGLETEIAQVRAQQELQGRRVQSAELTVKRYEGLVASHFMSEASLQQKQEELLDQRSQLANLGRTATGLQRDLDAARAELASSSLRRSNNSAQIGRQLLELEQQLTEADTRRTVVLTAATDGTVTTILAEVGQTVNPGTPLLSVLPAGASLEAELLVPTRAAGFIRPGQQVALRYQAFPYQRFGHHEGEVLRVGRTVIQPNEASLPVALSEPVYRVTVRLPAQQVLAYGQPMNLQAGMAVDADIRIDRRRVIEWLLDPLFSVTGRV